VNWPPRRPPANGKENGQWVLGTATPQGMYVRMIVCMIGAAAESGPQIIATSCRRARIMGGRVGKAWSVQVCVLWCHRDAASSWISLDHSPSVCGVASSTSMGRPASRSRARARRRRCTLVRYVRRALLPSRLRRIRYAARRRARRFRPHGRGSPAGRRDGWCR
jgi:hypothetical protein